MKTLLVVRHGKGELVTYRVNLRARRGSQLGQDIWGALESRITTSKSEDKE